VEPGLRRVRVAADMRYVGQHHEVTVEFPLAELDAADGAERIERAFHGRHEDLYGFSSPGRAMEVIGLHATVLGGRAAPPLEAAANEVGGSTVKGTRRAWLPISRSFAELEVHDGDRLAPGVDVPGPALVERATTTVLVPEEFNLTVDTLGSLVLTNQSARGQSA
jgi:N-methylhydantoinase A